MIRETLLKLSNAEKEEREKVKSDYYFYRGKCEDFEKAKSNKAYLGQNWEDKSSTDYEPTQDIRNKVKPILKKQARWMFSKEPDIYIIPFDIKKSKESEELRQFIDNILRKNQFWRKTREAFLSSTIKKRVMLRAAARDGYLNLRYDDISNFSYEEIDGKIIVARFFQEDKSNNFISNDDDKIYYIHKFSYESIEGDDLKQASYTLEKYKGSDAKTPYEIIVEPLGFSTNTIPVWLIKNGGELGEEFGETDLHDLKPIQIEYNKRVSDLDDAIKFQLYGSEVVIDGKEEDVNNFQIVAGALHAVHTDEQAASQGKQAIVQRLEYNMNNTEALEKYLNRAEKDMHYIIDLPDLSDLNNIPSAKAMRYLYNDLIARCEEKWNYWGTVLEELIRYIISIASESKLPGFKSEWANLEFTLEFKHNYPIPSDEEEKKQIAINEVLANARSRQSYIKEFSREEDYKKEFNMILEETSLLSGADVGEFGNNIDNKDDDKTRIMDEE